MNRVKHKILHGIARIANRFRGGVSVVRRQGTIWALSKDNFVDRHLINRYYFEPDRLAKCIAYIKKYNIDIFLDIGANFGLYSLHLARHSNLSEIHAFEPVKQNFNQLCANIFLNRRDRVITPYHLALSDQESVKTIFVDSIHTGISKFHEWTPEQSKKIKDRDYYSESVQAKRLDQVLSLEGRRLLIKIDVEGHELEVLRGMTSTLAHNRAVLQIEIKAGNERSAEALMQEYFYDKIDSIDEDFYFSNF